MGQQDRHSPFGGCKFLFLVLLLCVFAATNISSGLAAEKDYPNRPINLILGFSPGGVSDLAATIIGEKLSLVLGQQIVPVYKPGAGGILAASYVQKAKPDGYTMLLIAGGMFLPIVKLDYTHEDFIFLAKVTRTPYFFAVQAQSRWKTLKEFVEEAKKDPGKLNFGTTGTNMPGYFLYTIIAKYTGIKLTMVPFKSCGEAMTALLGGHVDAYSCAGGGAVAESKLVRVLAIPEEKRLEGFENVPTFTELGYPFVYSGGHSFAVRKGTPPEIVKKLTDAIKITMEKYSKEIGPKLINAQMWPVYYGPKEAFEIQKAKDEVEMKIMKEGKAAGK
jgi:tripartite-type tricarboxylate transporter receptor subunit TctC